MSFRLGEQFLLLPLVHPFSEFATPIECSSSTFIAPLDLDRGLTHSFPDSSSVLTYGMHSSLLASLVLLLLLACCGLSLEADNHQAIGPRDAAGVKQVTGDDISALPGKREDSAVSERIVGGPEAMTSAQIDDVSKFLQSLTGQVPQRKLRSDGLFLFWKVNMTDGMRAQSLGHPGISSVELNLKLVDARILPAGSPAPKERWNIQYGKRELAPRELAAISQPRFVSGVLQYHL